MEYFEQVTVNSGEMIVSSESFTQEGLVQIPIENLEHRLSISEDDSLSQNPMSAGYSCESDNNEVSDGMHHVQCSKLVDGVLNSVQMDRNNRQDTYSLASSYSSVSSSSSSLSSMSTAPLETHRRPSNASVERKKSFGPANEAQDNMQRNHIQAHPRIRRVPSTANPKYRVPNLNRGQRSKSQPHIQVHPFVNQRRNSSPSQLGYGNVPVVHSRTNKPSVGPGNQQQKAQNGGQQIIYLQIPHPTQTQLSDPQRLQQQISSQLQLLVPQIYNQLMNQMNVAPEDPSNPEKVTLNHVNETSISESSSKKDLNSDNSNLTSSFTMEGNPSQRMINQMLQQNSVVKNNQKPQVPQQTKRLKQAATQRQVKDQTIENVQEKERLEQTTLNITDLNQILQHIPPHILQQNQSNSERAYIEIQQVPGYPKITIPVTQELLLQCQQLPNVRDSGFSSFQPRLPTILEESLSVKHMKISRFSKTKIVACVLTVLCVIVVILLAGDKTVAVAVVAAIFIVFLLGSMFYLYTHSTKGDMDNHSLASTESQRLQVSAISASCGKPSLA